MAQKHFPTSPAGFKAAKVYAAKTGGKLLTEGDEPKGKGYGAVPSVMGGKEKEKQRKKAAKDQEKQEKKANKSRDKGKGDDEFGRRIFV